MQWNHKHASTLLELHERSKKKTHNNITIYSFGHFVDEVQQKLQSLERANSSNLTSVSHHTAHHATTHETGAQQATATCASITRSPLSDLFVSLLLRVEIHRSVSHPSYVSHLTIRWHVDSRALANNNKPNKQISKRHWNRRPCMYTTMATMLCRSMQMQAGKD